MPVYPDYKYNAFVRYLGLCKAGEEPQWGEDPVFQCYSENMAKKSKNNSTLVSSRGVRQSLINSANKFDLSEDQTYLTRNGNQVLREGEYEKVLHQLHDEEDHPGILQLRSKIFAQYADVCYDRIDNYVRDCQVCSMKRSELPVSNKRKPKPRAKRVNTKKDRWSEPKQKVRKAAASSLMCYPLRLLPGAEIKTTLQKFVEINQLHAAFVLSCVGSVRTCNLRLADSETMLDINTNHEIVSLTGTLSAGGHLHASLADETGMVTGGHVMGNMKVFTTAEIVIGNMPSFKFRRTMDKNTSYKELAIDPSGDKD